MIVDQEAVMQRAHKYKTMKTFDVVKSGVIETCLKETAGCGVAG